MTSVGMGSVPAPGPLWRTLTVVGVGYALVLAVIAWQVLSTLSDELERHGEQSNRQFTRMFTNDHWERLKPLLRLGSNAEEARSNPDLDEITSLVRRFAAGTELVAVKIFNAQGLVLYATDRSLVGADRSRSAGFLSSLAGAVVTERIHRDRVSGFDGEIHHRDLVASYVPVRTGTTIEAVIEIYTDRTSALVSARETGLRLLALIAALAALPLLAFLKVSLGLRRGWAASDARAQTLSAELAARGEAEREATREAARLIELAADHMEAPAARAIAASRASAEGSGPSAVAGDLEAVAQRARELRNLARLESGRVTPGKVAFDAGDLVRRAAQRALADAASADVTTLLHVAPSAEGTWVGDPALVAQALEELAALAVRQTPGGGSIHLRVQAESDGLTIDVLDTGANLTARQSALLRGEPAGAGCGVAGEAHGDSVDEIRLRIVAGLVRAMEGRIAVRSDAGRGNSTHLWLPLRSSPPGGR